MARARRPLHTGDSMSQTVVPVFVSAWAPGLQAVRTRFQSRFVRSFSQCWTQRNGVGLQQRRLLISMAGGNSGGNGLHRQTGIIPADLEQEMSRSYMEYAMSVILGRAMPDVRDGLKPVHRRILFAMHELGLAPSGQFRKSARVVGEVLGKYHPHGDTAVYDALVRMAQHFSMSIPLVNGHGNFGSTDGDPAAAMRYTECKLASMAKDVFLADMGRDTVSFIPNFDGSENEPLVLPARVPNLLVNGSAGIAVGMATNIPPHNLGEIIDALTALIKDPHISDRELLSFVPGPDFPTGGQILGLGGARDMYLTGRGRILTRACAHSEVLDGGTGKRRLSRDAIVVTELPYQVNKAVLVGKIADLVNEKKLEGISDLRDESDRNGTRIVIELKRDAKVSIVLNNLFKKTQLQSSFSANVMALDNGRFPARLTLRDCLEKFLSFRRDTLRRRVRFDLKRAEDRLHIVEGFLVVQRNMQDVVTVIRASKDSAGARQKLMENFELSVVQADAVLGMQLRRLTSLEYDRLEAEGEKLRADILEFQSVLANADKLDAIIVKELEDVRSKFSTKRRSMILEGTHLDAASINELSLMSNEPSIIVVTQQGYVKRMPTSAFESQNRGTRGKRGVGRLREGDKIAHFFTCMTHDSLIAISKSGVAYDLPAHKVPLSSLGSRGVPMFQLLPAVPAGETMASVIPVSEHTEEEYLVLLTRCGLVKKTPLSLFRTITVRGKRIINLDAQDELKWVRKCTARDTLLIGSQFGYVIRFATDTQQLRPSGRSSRGVRSMRLVAGDFIADMDVIPGDGMVKDADKGGKSIVLEDVEHEEEDEEEEYEEGEEEDDLEDVFEDGDGDLDAVFGVEHEAEEEDKEDEEGETDDDVYVLAVTSQGIGKRMRTSKFRVQQRGGRGVIGIKLGNTGAATRKMPSRGPAGSAARHEVPTNRLVALQRCESGDSVMVVTRGGRMVRTSVSKIMVKNRFSRGVSIQRLGKNEKVAAVAVLPFEVAVGEEDEEQMSVEEEVEVET